MGIKKVSRKISVLNLDEQIWPMERDIFFRPARLKYVRKLIKSSGCVFCLAAKKIKSENKEFIVGIISALEKEKNIEEFIEIANKINVSRTENV